jgi:hypothetical protein
MIIGQLVGRVYLSLDMAGQTFNFRVSTDSVFVL